MVYIHTVEYHSAIKKEILPFATRWTYFDSIMLEIEKSQEREKTNTAQSLYVESKTKQKPVNTENRLKARVRGGVQW